ENPYENAFNVKVNKTEAVSELRDAIKEKKQNDFANVDADKLKLWKVDISLEEENEKLKLVNTKVNVNIKEELGGVELLPLSKISKHFPSQPADEHIHIIVQRPVETKEVHCTATYWRKSANFQWTVTRETVTLE
ncbi:5278_t:CDS:1, partial [Funneliformis geosporum]